MRDVQLTVRVAGTGAGEAFDRIGEFAKYPDLVDVVRSVILHPARDGEPERSDWEVYFRNGILRWTEDDVFDRDARRITFAQVDGDFEEFAGAWQVSGRPGGCEISFAAGFDFGIPSLAGILDPIAERVLKETIARVIAALFDPIEIVGDEPVAAALARHRTAAPARIGAA